MKFKKVRLYQGQHALVDIQDYALVSAYKWSYSSCNSRTGYATTIPYVNKKRKKQIKMHNLIFGGSPGTVDHINGNGLDNRRINLRLATVGQQAYNKPKSKNKKTPGCKGVSITRDRNKKPKYWIARITVSGKRIYLGTFKNHIAASRAYIKAAKKYHKEFARWA